MENLSATIVLDPSKKESMDSQLTRQLRPIAEAAWAQHPNNPAVKLAAIAKATGQKGTE